jgi:hypothetical protein
LRQRAIQSDTKAQISGLCCREATRGDVRFTPESGHCRGGRQADIPAQVISSSKSLNFIGFIIRSHFSQGKSGQRGEWSM